MIRLFPSPSQRGQHGEACPVHLAEHHRLQQQDHQPLRHRDHSGDCGRLALQQGQAAPAGDHTEHGGRHCSRSPTTTEQERSRRASDPQGLEAVRMRSLNCDEPCVWEVHCSGTQQCLWPLLDVRGEPSKISARRVRSLVERSPPRNIQFLSLFPALMLWAEIWTFFAAQAGQKGCPISILPRGWRQSSPRLQNSKTTIEPWSAGDLNQQRGLGLGLPGFITTSSLCARSQPWRQNLDVH